MTKYIYKKYETKYIDKIESGEYKFLAEDDDDGRYSTHVSFPYGESPETVNANTFYYDDNNWSKDDLIGKWMSYGGEIAHISRLGGYRTTRSPLQTWFIVYYDKVAVLGKSYFIEDIVAEDGTYPRDGISGGYWYVRGSVANTAPSIDGYRGSSSVDLGTKMVNFNIEYTVTDKEGGAVTVAIYHDTTKIVNSKTVSLGYKNIYNVNLANFTIGNHCIKIIAKDSSGATSTRSYNFYKSNTAPVISGTDEFLGEKNTAFTYDFTVTDPDFDQVVVVVTLTKEGSKLPGEEILNITNAIGSTHTVNITDEKLATLDLGGTYSIEIKADDGKTGVSYRRLTFTKVNKAPIISGNDRDLGVINSASLLADSFSITDLEGDAISAKIFLDDRIIYDYPEIVDNKVYNYEINTEDYVKLAKGAHAIKIISSDDKKATSERLIAFTKRADKMEFILSVNETDTPAIKILAILKATLAPGDVLSIKATNNYADSKPVWEDITDKSVARMVHQYQNKTLTAAKGQIAIWVTVAKGSPEEQRSVITGMSGGYE